MKLGDLERNVMEVHWARMNEELSVRDVAENFPDHAYTTIMTVLTRLAAKGFLIESKQGRLNYFRARAPREDYITSLMMEALSSTSDRQAVLARFVEEMPASDANFFRKIFARRPRR
jgi:predicted transcriptional regulator